jgi:hypothetical protein
MKKNLLFVMAALLVLAPWPVVYAYEGANADTTQFNIVAADETSAPRIEAYGKAVGSVTAGELFQVDLTGIPADTPYTLMMTNADEMMADFRFMNMEVGVYVQAADGAGWEPLQTDSFHQVFISMHSGLTDFTLPGGAKYKITIEHGCFYCYGAGEDSEITAPAFHLEADL